LAVSSIVVGVDGTAASLRALAMAVGVASREKSFVHACFVSHTTVPAMGLAVGIAPMLPDEEEDGGDLGRTVREELERAGVRGEFTICTGDVGREIEVLADGCHADLIVVGRSRHQALHVGGVPRRLLATGRWPVLVVP
jgi:nucleotide-binding universal stress UspA family protein